VTPARRHEIACLLYDAMADRERCRLVLSRHAAQHNRRITWELT
jgi:hypothetical protein